MSQNLDEEMVIRDITANLTTLSVPFTIPVDWKQGVVPPGKTLIWNTGSIFANKVDRKSEGESRALGPVQFIAVLNIEHHLFLSDWVNTYPDAMS